MATQSIRFLYYIGRAGVILLDKLHFDPIIRHWVRPRRGSKGGLSKSTSESGVAQKPVPWMSHISRLCVTKLCASESCLDQPTEPSRTDPMQFTYFVLNLRRSPERLRDFCQVARAAGLSDIETIEAIDGQTLKVKDWHTFHKISQLVSRAICEVPPTTYIQSADHMSRCACNLNRSSSVCGEEAGQGDEYICT